MEKQRQRKVNNRSGIVICGSYGLGNAGDESILKAILQEVRTVAPAEETIGTGESRSFFNSVP